MKRIAFVLYLTFVFAASNAQQSALQQHLKTISENIKGKVGASVLCIETGEATSYNGTRFFPMQSVFKFPIAMAVLDKVDKGAFTLSAKIHITKDMLPNMYSPIRDKYPDGNVDLTIKELLGSMVSLSDNIACDILLEHIGGAQEVETYLRRIGIKKIDIRASEKEMHAAWDVQYTNRAQPNEMIRLLKLFYSGKVLSEQSNAFLLQTMTETSTGLNRIKGLLPVGTIVAHKTGTSDTNDKGITAATNDVGIVTLPNGKHLAIAVFVSDSPANEKQREGVIAQIAKAAWDAFYKVKE